MTDNSPKVPLEKSGTNNENNAILRSFLEHGGDINAVDADGYSLLMRAAELGNIDIVTLLIENGVDLNVRNNDVEAEYFVELVQVRTALMLAAENGHLYIVRLLIEAGATIDFVGEDESNEPSALTLAAKKGHLYIVKLLVEKGAKIESTAGPSALMYAAQMGYYSIVEFLIDKGADVDYVDDIGDNALELAEENGHNDIAALLRKHGATSAFDNVNEVVENAGSEEAVENVDIEEAVENIDIDEAVERGSVEAAVTDVVVETNSEDGANNVIIDDVVENESTSDILDNDSSTRKRKIDEEKFQGQPEYKRAKVDREDEFDVEDGLDVEAAILEAEADAREIGEQLSIIDEDSDANRPDLDTKITRSACLFFKTPVDSIESDVTRATSPKNH